MIASPALLDELVDVLARPRFRRFITTAVAAEFIDGLATDAVVVADPPEPPEVSPDPDDDYLIALARVAHRLPRLRRPAPPRPHWPGPAGAHTAPIPRAARDGVVMRVAVIADIHGDIEALRQVLTEIDRADTDQIWCLGDIVGLGATAPAEVVDLVRDRCALALAGNHDRWVTGQLSLSMLPLPRQSAQLQWQHRVLSNEQLAWLAALPAQGRAHDIELWHGSVQDPITGWISSPQDAADHLARQEAPIGLVGQTHRPLIAENNGTRIDYDEHPDSHDLADDHRAVLNPGAVLRALRWLELDLAARHATWHAA